MSDDTQKTMISILATGIAFVLATKLAGRFIEEPEVRGVRDDAKEAALQAAFSLISTILASVVIRRVLGGR